MGEISDNVQRFWADCIVAHNMTSATLLHNSDESAYRRVYMLNNRVYKIISPQRDSSLARRHQDLAGEFAVLRHCGFPGVPSAIEYKKEGGFQFLVTERLPGEPLCNMKVGRMRWLFIAAKVGWIIFRLSLRGISHNDITRNNILVTSQNEVSLIDFDQATRHGFVKAFIRQFIGLTIGGKGMHGFSLFRSAKRYLRNNVPLRIVRLWRKLRAREVDEAGQALPKLPRDASDQLKALAKAWKIAQISRASAPGNVLAYYSLDINGYYFPGERRWMDRWKYLRSATDYSGKRVLELGCNMGLLSCFLLKESGVVETLSVDVDPKILKAAEQIGCAYGVKPTLKMLNLDWPANWESELSEFRPDIVFALNVLNWVKDKQRLLNFLGRFPELFFEGHDTLETETARLRNVGFHTIDVVCVTERGRHILHCRK